MKNIHVLLTDKPSRLFLNKNNNQLFLNEQFDESSPKIIAQNIYLTSNEEIKEGDWVIVIEGIWKNTITKVTGEPVANVCRKIILTTDQDLIKDGVQAIDDDFLEWFVKNPSCEEVKYYTIDNSTTLNTVIKYNIIIPKEEPDYTALLQPVGTKQETLEEAAERYVEEYKWEEERDPWFDFMEGAKWQSERMYSEEEVRDLLQKALTHQDDGETGSLVTAQGKIRTANFFSWFEQNKKK